ncbi:putative polysaccharide biosynthesis protein [Listeria valentina]|uniref:putative polysaccharide biosynthesis protein n=1 Tax=Listeria valentina TaxID=2705293 RepID=UPI00143000E6|nr:polysaccharide biosynthesis protein [Listeria valentina]
MTERSIKNLMHGALLLTLASLVSKILSAIYRVPFQNLVGDVGFYIFQQVYPIYGIAMTLALGGFPVVVSKMMAEAEYDLRKQRIILQSIYRTLKVLCYSLFGILFLGAGLFASLMGDSELSSPIRVISLVFLLTPQLAFLRGYFQGQEDMRPTAISQTVEQIIRVSIILLGSWLALRFGKSLSETASFAMSGAVFGGLAAVFLLRYFYKKRLSKGGLKIWGAFPSKTEKKGIGREFLRQSLAICTVSAMLILFQLADSFQVYRLMAESGIPELTAKSLKGIYDRGQPILQLGLVLSSGLALALVPMITAARVKNERRQLERSVRLAVKLTLILSGAETVGLIIIMRPLNQMLFETSDGTFVLQMFIPAVLLSSLIIMTSSILQGFGKIAVPAVAVVVGLAIKILFNSWLVPEWSTLGAAISTSIGLLAILLICGYALKQNLRVDFIAPHVLLKLGLALLFMCVIPVCWELFIPFESRLGSAVQAIGGSLLGGFVFLLFTLRYRLLEAQDFVYLPFGSKLYGLSRRLIKK